MKMGPKLLLKTPITGFNLSLLKKDSSEIIFKGKYMYSWISEQDFSSLLYPNSTIEAKISGTDIKLIDEWKETQNNITSSLIKNNYLNSYWALTGSTWHRVVSLGNIKNPQNGLMIQSGSFDPDVCSKQKIITQNSCIFDTTQPTQQYWHEALLWQGVLPKFNPDLKAKPKDLAYFQTQLDLLTTYKKVSRHVDGKKTFELVEGSIDYNNFIFDSKIANKLEVNKKYITGVLDDILGDVPFEVKINFLLHYNLGSGLSSNSFDLVQLKNSRCNLALHRILDLETLQSITTRGFEPPYDVS